MNFIKKYWLWIILLLAAGYGLWYWYDQKQKAQKTDAADKPEGTQPSPGLGPLSLPDLLADTPDTSGGYDASGIAAGIV